MQQQDAGANVVGGRVRVQRDRSGQRLPDPVPRPGQDLHLTDGVGGRHDVVVEAALLVGDRLGQRRRNPVGGGDLPDLRGRHAHGRRIRRAGGRTLGCRPHRLGRRGVRRIPRRSLPSHRRRLAAPPPKGGSRSGSGRSPPPTPGPSSRRAGRSPTECHPAGHVGAGRGATRGSATPATPAIIAVVIAIARRPATASRPASASRLARAPRPTASRPASAPALRSLPRPGAGSSTWTR